MDAIMQDIADYERTHGVQETPEAKAALVAKIMKKRRPDLIPVGEPLSSEPAANGNRTIAANNNSDPRAAPKRAVGDNDEDDLMK
jgi:hypothetical protein